MHLTHPRVAVLICLIFVSVQASAEQAVCRYCAEGLSHSSMPLGLSLEGKHQYAPDRQVDVLHIKLDVVPNFDDRTVTGTSSITAKPIAKPVSILKLDAIDIQVKAVRCDGGSVKEFVSTREGLQIAFTEPIPVDKTFRVDIDYFVHPIGGLYFRTEAMGYPAGDTHIWTQGETHEARRWFPCFDYPNERSSTEVICHVPPEMTVLSNGKRMGESIDAAGLKAVHWLQEKPHANYLICLVAGHLGKLEKKYRDISLGFYSQPSLFEHAPNSFVDTPTIMEFYEQEIGIPFPWDKYDQVTILDFTAGGMENTSLTTLTSGTIFSSATENVRSSRGLDAHELAHQWFGDLVTCKDWSHLWLNEGFATFYTHLYEGHKFGRDAMLYGLYRDATGSILTQDKDTRPIVYNGYKDPMEQFDYRSYPKGSWVLHMLRSQLGEELYRKCIHEYLQKHQLTSVVSDDLRQVIETHSGRTMDRFFDQWLYHARHPDLNISYQWLSDQGLAKVTIKQTHAVNDDVVLFHFPTKLRFVVNDQTIDHEIVVSSEEEDFYVPLAAQPSIVRFDPDYSVLAKVSFDLPNDLIDAQVKNNDDMIGRLIACERLAERKNKQSVELLVQRLKEDPFFGVRIAAAQALSKHETDEAYDALKENWKSQTDARVRNAVVERMLNRFHPDNLELALSVIAEEKNPAIQAIAIRSLSAFHGEQTRNQLIALLDSQSFGNELAGSAISAIGEQNDPAYMQPLFAMLKKRHSELPPRELGKGLSVLAQTAKLQESKQSGSTAEVFDFLCDYLNDPRSSVQVSAINALGALSDPRAQSVLRKFADSNDPRTSSAAKSAIDKLTASKPVVPDEMIELRNAFREMQSETKKLKEQLETLQKQQAAKVDDKK
jgi:aminopeptidase N